MDTDTARNGTRAADPTRPAAPAQAAPAPADLAATIEAMRHAALLDAALLDVEALAALLSVSPAHVWRLRAGGKLPEPLRLGAQVLRWPLAEIRAWLAARCPPRREWEVRHGRR
jgi:predicted DNA-binding transcriptional regulator AlpA